MPRPAIFLFALLALGCENSTPDITGDVLPIGGDHRVEPLKREARGVFPADGEPAPRAFTRDAANIGRILAGTRGQQETVGKLKRYSLHRSRITQSPEPQ